MKIHKSEPLNTSPEEIAETAAESKQQPVSHPCSPNPQLPGTRLGGKRRGDLAEAAFLLKAATFGFAVARPWSNTERYDFILDNGSRSWRVQVKSAFRKGNDGYSFVAAGHAHDRRYTAEEIDFIVAYVAPHNAWYVLPIAEFANKKSFTVLPHTKYRRSIYEKYREAWCLMACPKDGCRKEIEVERCCQRGPAGTETRCPNER